MSAKLEANCGGTPDEMRRLGRAHGYPECCIEAFVADLATNRPPGQLRPMAGEGHIMCAACAKRDGWQLLSDGWEREEPTVAAGYAKTATLKITTGQLVPAGGEDPAPSRVLLEGHDISHLVRGLTFRCAPGEPTVATLEVYIDELDVETVALIAIASPQPKRLPLAGYRRLDARG